MRYIILNNSNMVRLQDLVNEYIERGWKPLGGLVTSQGTPINDDTTFYQSLTHKKLDPIEND